jgi:soluble lytic murein transglycosylase
MSSRAHTAPRRAAYGRRKSRPRRQAVRRRRIMAVLATALVAGLIAALSWPTFHDAVQEIALPLRHEDIIRQQARDKDLDPAMIAAVIYTESRFRDGQTSHAGARGLMQITPATAQMIAHKSGGTAFTVEDLATPQVNIAYGAWYLRYLLDRYAGNETLALAAYNGGEGNVDRWLDEAQRREEDLKVEAIPFPETREYVKQVQQYEPQYRQAYAAELGL